MNPDEHESIVTHWIVLYVNAENLKYFDSFGAPVIQKKIRQFIGNKMLWQIFIENKHTIQ